ncbi:hypothetical protein [Flavobacterium limnosediminis]|nr:hypothetical protein [Flavobacterium limnosediminis]
MKSTYGNSGKANNIKMKPFSERTDFSYDFQDLDIKRIEFSAPQNQEI